MLNNQPSRTATSASRTYNGRTTDPGGSPGLPRHRGFTAEVVLIHNWLRIIRQCAMVTGHGTMGGTLPEVEELLQLLEATEEAIALRVESGPALLDQLSGWEASLMHWEPETNPQHCLTCRRAKGVPDELPADYAWAVRVLEEAA